MLPPSSLRICFREVVLAVQSQVHKHPALLKDNQGVNIFNKTCAVSNSLTDLQLHEECDTLMKLMGQFDNLKNLCEVENDLFTSLKSHLNPDQVSDEDYQSVLAQDHDLHRRHRILSQTNNIFGRPSGPMLVTLVILDAVINEVNLPVSFPKDQSTIELLSIVVKAARFNKLCARTFRIDNSVQGPFTSSASLGMFSELTKEICNFNEKAAHLQIQHEVANYPIEGKVFCYIRLIATDCKLMISAEKDSLFKSLAYLKSRRNDMSAPRSSRGNRRGRPY